MKTTCISNGGISYLYIKEPDNREGCEKENIRVCDGVVLQSKDTEYKLPLQRMLAERIIAG